METNYRKNIAPWPSQIKETHAIRPLMHRDKIEISEPFQGDCITLVNANLNKGVHQFLDIARKMPERRFLAVLPYYGELNVPPAPGNVEWVKFDDDIRTILKRTRILLVPSYYESFGRIAVEAMLNRIPVLYSAPTKNSVYPGGSTEGLDDWIRPAGIPVVRDNITDWVSAIQSLDDAETYTARATHSRDHIEAMDLFTEATRIAELIESFARRNPVVIRAPQPTTQGGAPATREGPPRVREPPAGPRPGGFGFSNGRLRIQR
jgi:glycosyltransferase involved in cell wall biosynthesis